MNEITQICLLDLHPKGPYCLGWEKHWVKRAQRSLSWSRFDQHAYLKWWGRDAFHSPTAPAQLFSVKLFRHLKKEKSVLVLEKIWHCFGDSQKSYMFFSTSSATTDCCVTHDHILFEHKKAMVRSLPSPINGTLNESSFTSMICKTSMLENKQKIFGDMGLSAAI